MFLKLCRRPASLVEAWLLGCAASSSGGLKGCCLLPGESEAVGWRWCCGLGSLSGGLNKRIMKSKKAILTLLPLPDLDQEFWL